MPKSTNERARIIVREINKRIDEREYVWLEEKREYNLIFNVHKTLEKNLIAYLDDFHIRVK